MSGGIGGSLRASMFPNTVIGKPLVTINEGTAPNPVLSLSLFLGMMALFAWFLQHSAAVYGKHDAALP